MIEIIFATGNAHKAEELRRILPEYKILTLKDINFTEDIVEDGETFEENALIKARHINRVTNKTVVSDDSGICVDALGGKPGIHSARYAGEHGDDDANNKKLLLEMKDVKNEDRGAVFVSAAAVVFEDGTQEVKRGEVFGTVAFEEKGEFGFGYDPLFICSENNLRYAEMNDEQKNLISHRKRAFEKLKPIIDKHYL